MNLPINQNTTTPLNEPGQHITLHNALIDVLLPRLSSEGFKLLILMMRHERPLKRSVLRARSGMVYGSQLRVALGQLLAMGLVLGTTEGFSLNPDYELCLQDETARNAVEEDGRQ